MKEYKRLTKKCEVGMCLTETSGNIVYDYEKVINRLAKLEDKIENGTPYDFVNRIGKVIGEFVCDRVDEYKAEFTDLHIFNAMKKDVCLNEVRRVAYYDEDGEPYYIYETSNEEENPDDCKLLKESCLTLNELRQYIGKTFYDKSFYGWHISDLKIYDKPKELSEFYTIDNEAVQKCEHRERVYNNPDYTNGALLLGGYVCNKGETDWCARCKTKQITRPPQSWCYVEDLGE